MVNFSIFPCSKNALNINAPIKIITIAIILDGDNVETKNETVAALGVNKNERNIMSVINTNKIFLAWNQVVNLPINTP